MQRRFVAILAASIVALAGVMVLVLAQPGSAGGLVPFGDYAQLYAYLSRTGSSAGYRGNIGFGTVVGGPSSPTAPGSDYSGTNVQVAGIDELDTVKTDGTYLYLAAGHEVAIVDASALVVVARIPAASGPGVNVSMTTVSGIFVLPGRLVIVASESPSYPGIYRAGPIASVPSAGRVAPSDVGFGGRTYVSVYDLANPSQPSLASAFGVSGWPLTGRMIAPYVYVVTNEPVVRVNETYSVPVTCARTTCVALAASSIYYDPSALEIGSYTNVVALDAQTGEGTTIGIVTGYTSTVYMSPDSLYLTYAKWTGSPTPVPMFGAPVAASSTVSTWTTIHRIRVAATSLQPAAHGDVPGTLLNQYSLDENGGYLRVVTSEWAWSGDRSTQTNDLTILDASLATVGSLRGIAPGEYIRAARFMGDRAYLVTFQKTDPLFVFDVSDPAKPDVLGELQIPGYSDYLYPVDADHLLGIGKDTVNATWGDFSWYQGLKIALFNVSDVSHPTQAAQVVLGERGTSSDVLWDAKAFLPIPSRELAVLPVTLAVINTTYWGTPPPAWAYGDPVWQGVYVLHVSPQDGVRVVGRITQQNGTADPGAGVYLDYGREIHRSLYIGENLYTVSPSTVQANALADLGYMGSVVYA